MIVQLPSGVMFGKVKVMSSRVHQYRAKPVVISAIKYEQLARDKSIEEAQDRIAEFIGEVISVTVDDEIEIETANGSVDAKIGDYIIKGTDGEFYPCPASVFETKYERAD